MGDIHVLKGLVFKIFPQSMPGGRVQSLLGWRMLTYNLKEEDEDIAIIRGNPANRSNGRGRLRRSGDH
eukprot:54058-Eustigmatos_ZCMA.PRE.1